MLQIRSKTRIFPLFFLLYVALTACEDDSQGLGGLQGQGGSMARFAMARGYLYVADKTAIQVFQIAGDGALVKSGTVEAGFGIETIFATDENLFLGAQTGMHVFGLEDPAVPDFISTYHHILACDPVVVQGQYAYVTLRVSQCRTDGFNALEVIDITDLKKPTLVHSQVMESPYGLGVDKNLLFLCEGDGGLKVLDVTDPLNIIQVKHYTELHAYDVIPNKGVLLLTGNTGIYQYDYTDVLNIRQLSHIAVVP